MRKKHQVHNLIILDESGSMGSIKSTIIQGFNELVQTIQEVEKQQPEQKHFITFVSFNSLDLKFHHFVDPVSKLKQIDGKNYQPNALTPLYDAMGFSINKLKQHLQDQTDYNVLVTVLTDGLENASKEFSGNDIKILIEELKQNRWTFTYIGTDHDVESVAISLSINNTMVFQKDEADIKKMFKKEKMARERYCYDITSINLNHNLNYYRDIDELVEKNKEKN